MTITCRSPALTIDCNNGYNKRSLEPSEDEIDCIYHTPRPATLSKRPRDAHCFSPPPTPRGKCTTSRHVFVFDMLTSQQDLQAADILLPDLLAARVVKEDHHREPIRLKYKNLRRVSLALADSHSHHHGCSMPLTVVCENGSAMMPPPADRPHDSTPAEESSCTKHGTTSTTTKPDQHHVEAPARNCWTPNLPDTPVSAWKGTEYARCA
jgi:hypothetical protein